MTDVSQSSIGTVVGISAALPTTFDAEPTTGYTSLTFEDIGGIEDVPEFSDSWNTREFTPVSSGTAEVVKTNKQPGSATLPCATVSGDAGQAAAKTAEGESGAVAFKVSFPNGDAGYFTAKVTKYAETGGGAQGARMTNIDLVDIRNRHFEASA